MPSWLEPCRSQREDIQPLVPSFVTAAHLMAGTAGDQPDDPVAAASRLLRSGFNIKVAASDGTVVLRLQGELDMAGAPALARAINTALDSRPAVIALDLCELTFVDSTGLGVFIAGHRRATSTGCAFILRSPLRAVLRTLQLTGLDKRIDIDLDDSLV